MEWSTQVTNTPFIYGLGERVDTFLLDASNQSEPYGMFNRDQGAARKKLNLYGSHPMYLRINNETSLAHGVFMFNSNAMDVVLKPNYFTWQIIGGVIDLFFFVPTSSKPEEVVQLYTSLVGRPFLPSYFTLGRHQCRWGYHTIEQTQQVVERYALHQIPLDVMWNDIDYMDAYFDFTTDPVRFPLSNVTEFVNYLHNNDQHYYIIVDPGIAVQEGYNAYDEGLEKNVFLKTFDKSEYIEGKVWPGVTVFPDFLHPNATDFWTDQIVNFYNSGVHFEGLWADMSEPSSFCTGACGNTTYPPNNPYDYPPYNPVNAPLNTETITMSAQGYLGLEYNTHNLFGHSETVSTYLALRSLNSTRRTFVMPRSTFPSSGHYAAHWLGDNFSTWEYLENSIAGILSFQLFGIPLVGADICGFNSETTEELCTRWEQLGAFYPFSRNHNAIKMRSQEPYEFSTQHLEITKNSINLRYLLLPYFYTLFFDSHVNGTTVWKPLFFNFPTDSNTFPIDKQFMIGSSILVTPVTVSGATSVSGYFPASTWFDFYTGTSFQSSGSWFNLSAPIDVINVHLLAGSIIPTQAPSLTTAASRKNPFDLLIQLDDNKQASGKLILDDGESFDSFTSGAYTQIEFQASYDVSSSNYMLLSSIVLDGYSSSSTFYLGGARISNVTSKPSQVVVNGVGISTFEYSHSLKILQFSGILLPINQPFTISWQ